MEALSPLITQLISGAIGGNAVGAMLKQQATSMIVRTIVGAIGGVGGGLLCRRSVAKRVFPISLPTGSAA